MKYQKIFKNKRKIRGNDAYKYFITIGLNYISNK
jgi:hypothetical protein